MQKWHGSPEYFFCGLIYVYDSNVLFRYARLISCPAYPRLVGVVIVANAHGEVPGYRGVVGGKYWSSAHSGLALIWVPDPFIFLAPFSLWQICSANLIVNASCLWLLSNISLFLGTVATQTFWSVEGHPFMRLFQSSYCWHVCFSRTVPWGGFLGFLTELMDTSCLCCLFLNLP